MEDAHSIMAVLIGSSLVMFVIFVAPIWVFMHYKHKAREQVHPPIPHAGQMSDRDAADLITVAERMEQRVTALEAIMDAEAPGWRPKS